MVTAPSGALGTVVVVAKAGVEVALGHDPKATLNPASADVMLKTIFAVPSEPGPTAITSVAGLPTSIYGGKVSISPALRTSVNASKKTTQLVIRWIDLILFVWCECLTTFALKSVASNLNYHRGSWLQS